MQLGNKEAFKMFCIVMDREAKGEWQFFPIMSLTTLIPLNDFPWHVLPMS